MLTALRALWALRQIRALRAFTDTGATEGALRQSQTLRALMSQSRLGAPRVPGALRTLRALRALKERILLRELRYTDTSEGAEAVYYIA